MPPKMTTRRACVACQSNKRKCEGFPCARCEVRGIPCVKAIDKRTRQFRSKPSGTSDVAKVALPARLGRRPWKSKRRSTPEYVSRGAKAALQAAAATIGAPALIDGVPKQGGVEKAAKQSLYSLFDGVTQSDTGVTQSDTARDPVVPVEEKLDGTATRVQYSTSSSSAGSNHGMKRGKSGKEKNSTQTAGGGYQRASIRAAVLAVRGEQSTQLARAPSSPVQRGTALQPSSSYQCFPLIQHAKGYHGGNGPAMGYLMSASDVIDRISGFRTDERLQLAAPLVSSYPSSSLQNTFASFTPSEAVRHVSNDLRGHNVGSRGELLPRPLAGASSDGSIGHPFSERNQKAPTKKRKREWGEEASAGVGNPRLWNEITGRQPAAAALDLSALRLQTMPRLTSQLQLGKVQLYMDRHGSLMMCTKRLPLQPGLNSLLAGRYNITTFVPPAIHAAVNRILLPADGKPMLPPATKEQTCFDQMQVNDDNICKRVSTSPLSVSYTVLDSATLYPAKHFVNRAAMIHLSDDMSLYKILERYLWQLTALNPISLFTSSVCQLGSLMTGSSEAKLNTVLFRYCFSSDRSRVEAARFVELIREGVKECAAGRLAVAQGAAWELEQAAGGGAASAVTRRAQGGLAKMALAPTADDLETSVASYDDSMPVLPRFLQDRLLCLSYRSDVHLVMEWMGSVPRSTMITSSPVGPLPTAKSYSREITELLKQWPVQYADKGAGGKVDCRGSSPSDLEPASSVDPAASTAGALEVVGRSDEALKQPGVFVVGGFVGRPSNEQFDANSHSHGEPMCSGNAAVRLRQREASTGDKDALLGTKMSGSVAESVASRDMKGAGSVPPGPGSIASFATSGRLLPADRGLAGPAAGASVVSAEGIGERLHGTFSVGSSCVTSLPQAGRSRASIKESHFDSSLSEQSEIDWGSVAPFGSTPGKQASAESQVSNAGEGEPHVAGLAPLGIDAALYGACDVHTSPAAKHSLQFSESPSVMTTTSSESYQGSSDEGGPTSSQNFLKVTSAGGDSGVMTDGWLSKSGSVPGVDRDNSMDDLSQRNESSSDDASVPWGGASPGSIQLPPFDPRRLRVMEPSVGSATTYVEAPRYGLPFAGGSAPFGGKSSDYTFGSAAKRPRTEPRSSGLGTAASVKTTASRSSRSGSATSALPGVAHGAYSEIESLLSPRDLEMLERRVCFYSEMDEWRQDFVARLQKPGSGLGEELTRQILRWHPASSA